MTSTRLVGRTRQAASGELGAAMLRVGLLAVFITAVTVGILLAADGLGIDPETSRVPSIVAMVIVAVAFPRVRERATRLANRIVFGELFTPLDAVTEFSDRVAVTYETADVLPRMARVIAEGTGAARADVWLRVDSRLEHAASWPAGGARPSVPLLQGAPVVEGTDRAMPVSQGGHLLGMLTITKRPGEPVTATEDRLLGDLASQAGFVLRNVGMTTALGAHLEQIATQAAELRASRERIVAAQDIERRRIERDIHDGAQQHLVALAVQIGLAKQVAATDPGAARSMIADLRGLIEGAHSTLRDLAGGINPPQLVERGLGPTLESLAAQAGVPVEATIGSVGRYAPEIEAAVYFTCAEALQNAAKHAGGTVRLLLQEQAGSLVFSVADSGPGFDPKGVVRGSGLTNMADRIEAMGGGLSIVSAPGAGARVEGTLPIHQEAKR